MARGCSAARVVSAIAAGGARRKTAESSRSSEVAPRAAAIAVARMAVAIANVRNADPRSDVGPAARSLKLTEQVPRAFGEVGPR